MIQIVRPMRSLLDGEIRRSFMKGMFQNFAIVGSLLFAPALGPAVSSVSTIAMQDHDPFYNPSRATVVAGQSVQWHNQSNVPHTITHDGCLRGEFCAFESGPIHPDEQFTASHLLPGDYPYHCNIHPFMRGMVVVKRRPQEFSTEL